MTNAPAILRSLIVYALCVPLALVLGYLLSNPYDPTTLMVAGIILFTLLVPLLLRFHHAWLIALWNMSAVLIFLPGKPTMWSAMAAISLGIGILQYTINRNAKFISVPSVAWPLLFFTAVVVITMQLTGGIGLNILGSSSFGGKNYVGIYAAVIGYFALTSRRIPPKRATLYVTLFFLGAATLAIGDLPLLLPREFNFLYLVFPLLSSGGQALHEGVVGGGMNSQMRVTGLGFLSGGIFSAMLARYGIRGTFLEFSKPWRAVLLVFVVILGMSGGFRSILIMFVITFAVLFYLERLHRTRMLPAMVIVGLLTGTLMITFANRLPFMMQRSMAFLPINIDPVARQSAAISTQWRVDMWRELIPQIPQYLILGKGYSFSAGELFMMQYRGVGGGEEGTMLVGDYHNGPLSVIIPFGIFGSLGFLWFLWASGRVLYRNFKFGDPAYHRANTYLFAYFIAKTIFFMTVFGALVSDLAMFVGVIGVSISLNGGVAKPVVAPQAKVTFDRFKLRPAAHRPAPAIG
jgi:hypothetical protein